MSGHQDITFSPELRFEDDENMKLFRRVEDLLGPIGAPVLHHLADAIWEESENKSYENGYSAACRDMKAGKPVDDRARS